MHFKPNKYNRQNKEQLKKTPLLATNSIIVQA